MIWSDPAGGEWEVVDYHFVGRQRKRSELGDWSAEGRAFIPQGREAAVMLFDFGRVAYRDTADRTLRNQLAAAKPVDATAAARSWGK